MAETPKSASSGAVVKPASELRFQVRKRRSSADDSDKAQGTTSPVPLAAGSNNAATVPPPAMKRPAPPPISAFLPPTQGQARSVTSPTAAAKSRPLTESTERPPVVVPEVRSPVKPIEKLNEPLMERPGTAPPPFRTESPHRPRRASDTERPSRPSRRPSQDSFPQQKHYSSGEAHHHDDDNDDPSLEDRSKRRNSLDRRRRSFDEAEEEASRSRPYNHHHHGRFEEQEEDEEEEYRPRRRSIDRRHEEAEDAADRPRRHSNNATTMMMNGGGAVNHAQTLQQQATLPSRGNNVQAPPPEVIPVLVSSAPPPSVAASTQRVVNKSQSQTLPPVTCCDKTYQFYQTSPFCPSRTRALELFSILLDAIAVGFYVLALALPWVKSVAPCTNCPEEFSAGTYLAQKGIQVSFGIFYAGTLTNKAFLPVSEYFTALNTNQSLQWAVEYSQYYFPPGSGLLWTDITTNGVCSGGSPAYIMWGLPYGMCPYSSPSAAIGTQALLILACCFAGLSFMSMIAARKGRVGFAQFSAFCSALSFVFGLGGVLWFSLWGYTRQHIDIGRGTVPVRVVSRTGEIGKTAIVPLAANFVFDSGYIFCIFAIAFEIITTIISWVAGTEKCWWTPDDDVVYGPESWVFSDYEYPNKVRRPSLMEMSQRQHFHEQLAAEQYAKEMAMA